MNKQTALLTVSLAFSISLLGCINHDPSMQEPASGSLDAGFGDGGRVTAAVGQSVGGIAIQADGSIVAVGGAYPGAFAVARFKADGSLDTTFNGSGKITTSLGINEAAASAVAIQTDGKIVAVGSAGLHDSYSFFALARYEEDGSLDSSFGTGGTVTTSIGSTAHAHAIEFQPDGKIVVAGNSEKGEASVSVLVRYNTDGSLDTGFGDAGIVSTDVGTSTPKVSRVFVHPDGKITVAGFQAFIRYNPDGGLDTNFGLNGLITTASGVGFTAFARQKDGKIVGAGMAGSSVPGSLYSFALARFNIDGSLDTTFGTTGKVITDGTNGFAYDVAIQADGKIVAAGFSSDSSLPMFTLIRYDTNGNIDLGFNGTGIVTTPTGKADYATTVAIRPDGRIVAAGFSVNANNTNGARSVFAISQYWP